MGVPETKLGSKWKSGSFELVVQGVADVWLELSKDLFYRSELSISKMIEKTMLQSLDHSKVVQEGSKALSSSCTCPSFVYNETLQATQD